MTQNSDLERPAATPPVKPKKSIWQQLGAGSLSISLVVHLVLLAIGGLWVFRVITPVEKKVDFTPRSGGGGASENQTKVQQKRVQMTQANLSRVVALGATTSLTLPEPEEAHPMTSLGGLSSGALSQGLGGSGSGGGKGDGNGIGFGGGLAPGMSDGKGSKNLFGMVNLEKNALVGTFYDLKQTSDRKPTEMQIGGMVPALQKFLSSNLKERAFEKYYKAPRQLYQTKFMIPTMDANAAPAAFECDKEVEPSRWAVVYRGAVQAPKSGKFRFVGAADDVMAIRFNNKTVFDYGYTIVGAGLETYNNKTQAELAGTQKNSELEKNIRKNTPMRVPLTFYRYEGLPEFNNGIGGLVAGGEFEVQEGGTYPIEIMISEIPGGKFGVYLLIEEIGAKYEKAPGGAPILPIFRLDGSLPETSEKDQFPPFDPTGPIWKFVKDGVKQDI